MIAGLVPVLRRMPLPPHEVPGPHDAPGPRLAGLLLLGSVGIKPTVVPVLLSGTLVATVASSVVRRRLDVRLVGLSLVLLVLTVAMSLVSGTPGKLTVLGTLESLRPYAELIGRSGPRATDPAFVLSSLDGPGAWAVAIATIVLVVAGNGLRFLGLAALGNRTTRRDPVSRWLAGAYLSGWAAFFVVDHPSRGQLFFLGTVAIFGSVLFALLATTAALVAPGAAAWSGWCCWVACWGGSRGRHRAGPPRGHSPSSIASGSRWPSPASGSVVCRGAVSCSQAAITDPSAEVMAELRDRGVDWLVGVRRAGDVSPRIGEFAEQRFVNEQVAIYELAP